MLRSALKLLRYPLAALALLAAGSQTLMAQSVCPRCHDKECAYLVGINWAGPEFGNTVPGIEGRDYGWPTAKSLDYWKSKGVRLVRLPFLWERLQPTLMSEFDPAYNAGLQRSVKLMADRGMLVILDVHNYAKYNKKLIGSPDVPLEAFTDLWKRLAMQYKDNKAIWGYGLMNEPDGKCNWLQAAQAGIDGVRAVDDHTQILAANDYPGWAANRAVEREKDLAAWAESKMPIRDPGLLKDPANNLRFELHTYFDHDASGTYRKSYEEEAARKDGPEVRVTPMTGVVRMQPFVEWLKKHNARGFLGEYSAPANPGVDERWLTTLDNTMAYLQENCMPSAFWAGGTRWTQGRDFVVEPTGWPPSLSEQERKQDRPQLKIMQKYSENKPAAK